MTREAGAGRVWTGKPIRASTSWARAATPCGLAPKWAGEFHSFEDWCNRAQQRLTGAYDEYQSEVPAICVDNLGRRCSIGAHFMRARDESAFPVRYFFECTPTQSPAGEQL